ncbi:hypothetical protein THAOC_14056 [Thalassiosira oceanica]|uniref:Uncharacterized protein n=1 Tax=Thalassiosira oceanica TaxID=159749 RepID=K0T453_THAOC|nr:hypothetical protein THAOC_14056 [Thalassiosira oceanica]|eukprot:EJK65127.1 hypothetical protein THAOC_14056 [Thalassiosira oceanica]
MERRAANEAKLLEHKSAGTTPIHPYVVDRHLRAGTYAGSGGRQASGITPTAQRVINCKSLALALQIVAQDVVSITSNDPSSSIIRSLTMHPDAVKALRDGDVGPVDSDNSHSSVGLYTVTQSRQSALHRISVAYLQLEESQEQNQLALSDSSNLALLRRLRHSSKSIIIYSYDDLKDTIAALYWVYVLYYGATSLFAIFVGQAHGFISKHKEEIHQICRTMEGGHLVIPKIQHALERQILAGQNAAKHRCPVESDMDWSAVKTAISGTHGLGNFGLPIWIARELQGDLTGCCSGS